MSIYKIHETQIDTGTWASAATVQTDLLRNGPITRIEATVEVTPSATLAGANQPNGLLSVIQNLTVGAGGQTYFPLPADTSGGRAGVLLHYLNQWDGFGLGHTRGQITNPSRTYNPMTFILHAGSRRRKPNGDDNPFDLSAFIPASKLGRLTAQWVATTNDAMDSTVTISSAVIRYAVDQVLASNEAELRAEMASQGVLAAMQPSWDAERYAQTATATSYSDRRSIPVGGYIRRIALGSFDDTATRPVRAQDEVTGISIELPREGRYLYRGFVDSHLAHLPPGSFLVANDGATIFQLNAPEGIYVVDLRNHTTHNNPMGADYGVDARAYGRGDILLGFTITTNTSGDHTLILYERYVEIQGPLL